MSRPSEIDPAVELAGRADGIRAEATSLIRSAQTSAELEQARVDVLGRKAELPQLLRRLPEVPPERRGAIGQQLNVVRRELEVLLSGRQAELEAVELERRLAHDRVDISLPGDPAPAVGRLHILTSTRRAIEDVFIGLGYQIAEGPEVETVHYNFDALNHDALHPARLWSDTFYVADEVVLRTHTSPVQVRAMEASPPPLYIIVPGRVFRRDSDATHTPQFHQIEGLAVDDGITLADLQGTLLSFARAIFGDERKIRLRPHFFPFTEPSVEADVSCFQCHDGFMGDGSRCSLCKGTGWIEMLGAGMVDPNVFAAVDGRGYDPDTTQGFAFGMGIERIALLRHRVPDMRLLYENDVDFLEQF